MRGKARADSNATIKQLSSTHQRRKTDDMADMDNQPKHDLHGMPAAQKVKAIAEGAGVAMLITEPSRFPCDARPMALQTVTDDGCCWFLSSTQSDKNRDIASDPRVCLIFSDTSTYSYLHVSGQATIHTDRESVSAHWSALANAWFDGKDDPRVSVIRVQPEQGRYWETKSGKVVAGIKMALSALGADVDDGGVEGKLTF